MGDKASKCDVEIFGSIQEYALEHTVLLVTQCVNALFGD